MWNRHPLNCMVSIEGRGTKETVERFVACVTAEYAFCKEPQFSEDGCTVNIELDVDYIDQKRYEVATFINMSITIRGNGWALTKPVGKGFTCEVV